jgi:hypothetical protein
MEIGHFKQLAFVSGSAIFLSGFETLHSFHSLCRLSAGSPIHRYSRRSWSKGNRRDRRPGAARGQT